MNLTIRAKLLLGFAFIFLILVSATLFTVTKLADSNERLVNMVDNSSKRLLLCNKITITMLNLTRDEKNIILVKDSASREVYQNVIDANIAALDSMLIELDEVATIEGRKLIKDFRVTWGNYRKALTQIIALSIAGNYEKATQISILDGLKGRQAATSLVEELVARNAADMEADRVVNQEEYANSVRIIIILILGALIFAGGIAFWIIKSISTRIAVISLVARKIASREHVAEDFYDEHKDELNQVSLALTDIAQSFSEVSENAGLVAAGNYNTDFQPRSLKDTLGNAIKGMTQSLRETTEQNEKQNWLTTGQNRLNEVLRGDQGIEELASNTIKFLTNYLEAQVGAIYLKMDVSSDLELSGQYGLSGQSGLPKTIVMGEGAVGQAAADQKIQLLEGVEAAHIKVRSALVDAVPANVVVAPFMFEGETLGVLEIGRLQPITTAEHDFVANSMESIAISLNSALSRKRILHLIEETQRQSEELQSQQEELRQLNEELEEYTQNLRQQQEELQVTNEELEEQTQLLEAKNNEVEAARHAVEQKSNQLEQSSQYKSEFLANMSHELRTPLNSLLILSKDLADNKGKNLTDDQVESAEIINKSGIDLLNLINEVLDLSKIEAGKMTLNLEDLNLKNWSQQVYKNFRHQTDAKALQLVVSLGDNLPNTLSTDTQRIDQIVKNLLSNAIKFTEHGNVTLSIHREGIDHIAISVSDTGIGIPIEKQGWIFEAFQQAEGGTARRYGGTGLGLSISRKLAELLGGEITVLSQAGKGATFKLLLPVKPPVPQYQHEEIAKPAPIKVFVKSEEFLNYPSIEDDRNDLAEGDKFILIIEDDINFAKVVARQARQKGFKVISAATGEDGLVLAERYKPQAIILDIDLPGMDGNRVLAELKANPSTRHVPVHIMSGNERTIAPIKEGAVEYLTKPIDKAQLEEAFARMENFINRKMKNLLIIEDDPNARRVICKLIGNGDVKCMEAGSGEEGLRILENGEIDCIVLDLGLPDMSGFDFIHTLEQNDHFRTPPIIIYTGRELSRAENDELERYAESIIIKGVKSEERLLDETALFLHRTINKLPEQQRDMITSMYDKDNVFQGLKVLVVDDDMRNVFALSKVLKERGMEVTKAENGLKALEALENTPDVQIVLMDIMMPEMDGYEAMRRIRAQIKYKNLPVLALTAKAMKDDRQKCIDAGANDYISKPIDVDRLLSLMRVWLSK